MNNMKKILISLIAAALCSSVWGQSSFYGPWSGSLEIGPTSLSVVLNFIEGADGAAECTLDSPDQGAFGIKGRVDNINDFSVKISFPTIMAEYSGMLFRGELKGTFRQNGLELPLNLKMGVSKPSRPQTPQPPFPYDVREVSFSNVEAGATLSGTLTVPQGAGSGITAVIMVSGSGQQNRDEEIFEHRPFLVLADYLTRRGIAVLRYDDRGTGESKGGELLNATTVDFRKDAEAGIEFLRKDGRFGRIGVLGHSEGASIAFMLGAAGKVDFVISLAGTGVKGDEALTAQYNRVCELSGINEKLDVFEYRQQVKAQKSAWLSWFIDYDPTDDIRNTVCPVLALNGDRDVQLISGLNLTAIREKLPANPLNMVKEYPSLNHMFQHCENGMPVEYRKIEETMSPEVLEDIANWVNATGSRP